MMQTYTTNAQIKASPEAVWRILTDAPNYAAWNPEIVGIQGRFVAGERIKASVKVKAGGGKMAVRAVGLRVTALTPPTAQNPRGSMEWTGGLPFGLFTGLRILTVSPAMAAPSSAWNSR